AATVARFADHVDDHNSDASRIKEVCIDMSGAYIKCVTENLTEAEITFDKFHAVKLVNDAVDQVRRAESKDRPQLKYSRYLWLMNEREAGEQSGAICSGVGGGRRRDQEECGTAKHGPNAGSGGRVTGARPHT